MQVMVDSSVIVVHDWKSEAVLDQFCDIMNQPGPLFLARIGGSDYDCVRDYFNDKAIVDDGDWYKYQNHIVKSHNGYFDFENKKENFISYLETMLACYQNSNAFTYSNSRLINGFESNQFPPNEANFINHLCQNKVCINYTFIEGLEPFLRSFGRWATGKRILIVSPLSASVEHQYRQRDKLYNNYTFPDFDLLTYNTKITYSDEHIDSRTTLNTETTWWLDEAKFMAAEIAQLDFDIALLSCGSYAMYLGDFIKTNLQKKALYFGGVLNMFFNIYGGRYNHPGYRALCQSVGLNPEFQIDPIENASIENIKSGRSFKTESLNAYFGTRKKHV